MTHRVRITVEGAHLEASPGSSVAAALANAGMTLRRSVGGEARGALCGMGICHECRMTIDGRPHQRACLVTVVDGMSVSRDA